MKHRLLAIDTATEACSVAIGFIDSGSTEVAGVPVASRRAIDPRGHTRRVLPMVQSVLREADWSMADIDGLVCTRGPGSFTGVRVGVSAVQGLAFALDVPVLPVSTLHLLAWQGHLQYPEKSLWQVAMDARMNEVYWAAFRLQATGLVREGEEGLLAPDAMPLQTGESVGHIGTGWALQSAPIVARALDTELPDARALVSLAGTLADTAWVTAEALQPVYLRDKVTHR